MSPRKDPLRQKKRRSDWHRKESEIRQLVEDEQFQFASHVYDKIATNYWAFDDVVESILNGAIQEARKDELNQAFDGKKYTIVGQDYWGNLIETVGKILVDDEKRLYFVITAYQ